MPAETHQLGEQAGLDAVLDLLAAVVGTDVDEPATLLLADLGLDDDLAIVHLWEVVVEELGERSIGELDLDVGVDRSGTLGDLASRFHEALGGRGPNGKLPTEGEGR